MIQTLLIKTNAAVAANTATTNYRIYTGTQGSESDAGFTTVPSAIARFALGTNTWGMLIARNDGWEIVPFANYCWKITLSGTLADGASTSVTLSDGRSVTATNRSGGSLPAGNAIVIYDLSAGEYMVTGAGSGGGGSGTDTKIYKGPLYADLDASDTSVNVNGLTSLVSGVSDVGGTTSCENPYNWFGRTGDLALVIYNEPGTAYYIVGVERREETLECYVYTPFNKDTESFVAIVVRSYSNYTAVGTQIVVYNQEDFDPGADNPYLFEGESYAVCRVQYDTMSGRYRAVWVECPEETPEVAAQLNLVSQNQLFDMSEGALASASAFM